MFIDPVFVPEEPFDVSIIVEAACLKLRAERGVNARRHLVLDFVAETYEEAEVVGRVAVNWAVCVIKGSLELPVLVGSSFGPVESSVISLLVKISVLHLLSSVVCMEQVGPSDVHQHDEDLRLEGDLGIVEDLYCSQSSLPRFCQEFSGDGKNPAASFVCGWHGLRGSGLERGVVAHQL